MFFLCPRACDLVKRSTSGRAQRERVIRRQRCRQTRMHTMTQSSTDTNKITKWIHTGSHDEGQVSKQARQNGGDAARQTHCRNHVLGVHAGLGQHLRIDQEQVAAAGRGSTTGCLSNRGKLTTNWTIESVLRVCVYSTRTRPPAPASLRAAALRRQLGLGFRFWD